MIIFQLILRLLPNIGKWDNFLKKNAFWELIHFPKFLMLLISMVFLCLVVFKNNGSKGNYLLTSFINLLWNRVVFQKYLVENNFISSQPNILQIGSQKKHKSTISFLTKNLEKRKRKWRLQLATYQSWYPSTSHLSLLPSF